MVRSKLRAVVYLGSFLYYLVPPILFDQTGWEMPNVLQYLGTFLILGVSISAVEKRLVPKFFRPMVRLITYIPDRVEREVSQTRGASKSGFPLGGVFGIVQLFLLVLVNKVLVRIFLSRLVSLLMFVLFKSTMFTFDIVKYLVRVGESLPILLLLLLPVIKRGAWYYLVAYFAVCGGLTLLTGLGYFSLTMMVWRNLVSGELANLVGFS